MGVLYGDVVMLECSTVILLCGSLLLGGGLWYKCVQLAGPSEAPSSWVTPTWYKLSLVLCVITPHSSELHIK